MMTHENPGFGVQESVAEQRPLINPLTGKSLARPDGSIMGLDEVSSYAEEHRIRKFTDEDAGATYRLVDAAMAYAQAYQPDATRLVDLFMVAMKNNASPVGRGLTIGMVRGILNVMLAEHKYKSRQAAKQEPEQEIPTEQLRSIPKLGTYTVVRGDGIHTTIRIEPDFRQAKPESNNPDHVVASVLVGADNTSDFAQFAFVSIERGIAPWRNARSWNRGPLKINDNWVLALKMLCSGEIDAEAAGYKYALESGRCFVCGRTLTVPASIHAGMGPICAGRRNA